MYCRLSLDHTCCCLPLENSYLHVSGLLLLLNHGQLSFNFLHIIMVKLLYAIAFDKLCVLSSGNIIFNKSVGIIGREARVVVMAM